MASVTTRIVYISRKRQDIIDRVMSGKFLPLSLIIMDSLERPRKFLSYNLTRLSVGVDPHLVKEHPGV